MSQRQRRPGSSRWRRARGWYGPRLNTTRLQTRISAVARPSDPKFLSCEPRPGTAQWSRARRPDACCCGRTRAPRRAQGALGTWSRTRIAGPLAVSQVEGYNPSSCDQASGKGERAQCPVSATGEGLRAHQAEGRALLVSPLGAAVVPSYRAAASGDVGEACPGLHQHVVSGELRIASRRSRCPGAGTHRCGCTGHNSPPALPQVAKSGPHRRGHPIWSPQRLRRCDTQACDDVAALAGIRSRGLR